MQTHVQGSTRDTTINLAVASNLQVRITHTEWAASKLSFEANIIECAYIGAQFVREQSTQQSQHAVSHHALCGTEWLCCEKNVASCSSK